MYPGALPPRGAGHTFCSKSGKYAAPGLGCHRCYSAIVEMRTKGEVISNPGRRLALCVAPYFADRGVGDMRGPPNGVPNMPPPAGGGRPSSRQASMYYIIDRQDDTRQSTAVAQPRTTSGVRFGWSDLARPACRHDPAWRNTGLRTAATTSGVAEMLASGHRLRRWRRCGRCACW